jgi:peptide/nickel transport system substrate-binding protein
MRSRAFVVLAAVLAWSMPAGADVLRIGLQADPSTLDPAQSAAFVDRVVMAAVCDKLIEVDAKLAYVPQLATEWSWAPDGLSLTMKLRAGVTFHDGEPFDAEAVRFNIERDKTASYSRRKSELAPVKSVTVIDPLTVRLDLSEPYAPLLAQLSDRAGMMVSPKAAKEKGGDFAASPVCAGPYQFAERKARDLIRVKKFADYWDAGKFGYDEIVYYYIEDSTVRLSRLRAGDLDIAERIAPTDLAIVRGDGNLALHSAPGLAVSHLMVNVGSGEKANTPLGRDARLRKAFELAIDRNVINRVAFNGEFVADNQMTPPSSPFYSKAHPIPARNVAKAKELMAAAGATKVPVEITYQNALTDGRVAQIVQSMASEAGFEVKLLPLETATAIERYLNGNFEMYIGNWSGRPDPDPTLFVFFGCSGSQNVNKYCSKDMDSVLNAARAEANEAARIKLYEKATDIYLTDLPTIPIYHPNWFFAARKSVSGVVVYPDGLLRLGGVKPAS